ncbi:hypothetical protein J4227_01545 [Candidatus Woesearchaeota archaeon]|nr:hypothetical protein [Candidatus Woesearchaeota archaeon]
MKKMIYAVILLTIMLGTGLTSAQSFTSPEISVTFLSQDPDPAEPGNFLKARFKIENIGLGEAKDLQVEMLPEYPFSIYEDSAIKSIASISPRQKGNEAVFIDFNLKADDNALPGTYDIELRYKIKDGAWQKIDPFTVVLKQQEVIVTLQSVSTEPELVRPGDQVKLNLGFDNLAKLPVRYLKINLGLVSILSTSTSISVTELPLSPLSSTNELVFPLVKPSERVTATFNLVADSDAASKVYKIPVTYSYTDPSNRNYTKQNYISIMIGDSPELIGQMESSEVYKAGMSGEVIVKFVNKGLNQIKFLYATLDPTGDYDVLSPKEVYVGNIDSDDYETLSYKIYVKDSVQDSVMLPIHLEYKDVNNNDYYEDLKLEVKLFSSEDAQKMGLEKKSNALPILIGAVVVIIGFLVYRKLKKKK